MDLIFLKSLRPLYCDYISRILCVRRAQQRRPPRPPFMYFYSRPYVRGDDLFFFCKWLKDYFYSRPYARGDRYLLKLRVSDDISTRAPTRGATPPSPISSATRLYFYSRPYERGDVSERPQQQRHHAISTRAPTRGATAIFHQTIS